MCCKLAHRDLSAGLNMVQIDLAFQGASLHASNAQARFTARVKVTNLNAARRSRILASTRTRGLGFVEPGQR
jgi:hypothetical protein